jgi:uncharacterized protein (DUF3820 family)
MSNISINFPGGAHGNFLELVCNTVYGNLTSNLYDAVSHNGAFHLILGNDINYKDTQVFTSFPFWWHHPDVTFPKQGIIPTLTNKIVNITATSLVELTLLRMYWRRRGDCFFLSPEELLNTTSSKLRKIYNSLEYPYFGSSEESKKFKHDVRVRMFENVLAVYKNTDDDTKLSEMELILHWLNPWAHPERYEGEWLINMSKKWIDTLDEEYDVINFRFIWFYDNEKFVESVKNIGKYFNLTQQVSDSAILDLIKPLKSKVYEFPDLDLISEKFNSFQNKNNATLSDLTLNDKIALLTMISIDQNLHTNQLKHIKEFPQNINELSDAIEKAHTIKVGYPGID